MSRSNFWRLGLAVVGLLLVVSPVFGQAQQGNLYGTVTDEDGEALPGVTVTLSGIGAPRIQVTNTEGEFRFLGLDPGNYEVTAELEGFSTVEYPGVNIRVGRNTTLEIEMSSAIEEVITVTSESPLLDERKISKGTTVSQIELEKIPTARDPWSVVTQTPGVLSDRINVGGNESGQQAVFLGPGVTDDENSFAVDGVVITDMAAIGSSPTYYDFDQFEEMQISTGGSDVTKISAGVSLNLVTKRGTNQPRGSARFLLTDANEQFGFFEQADPDVSDELCDAGDPGCAGDQPPLAGNQINEVLDFGFEAGGPVVRDRLWVWGSYGRNDIKQFAASGTADDTLLENSAVKFNGQPTSANSIVGSWNRGDKIKNGRGAGPDRQLETTWDQSGPTEIWKIEDTQVVSSELYLTGLFSYVDGGFQLIPKGGTGPGSGDVLWDTDGVWKNTFIGGVDDRNTTSFKLDGSYFFNIGETSNELKFGGSYRQFEVESNFSTTGGFGWGGTGVVNIAGTNFGVPDGPGDFFFAVRGGIPMTETEYTSLWVQDTLSVGNLTANLGLRYDLQEGSIGQSTAEAQPLVPGDMPTVSVAAQDAPFDWSTVTPRLGVTYALGQERKTLLRASFSQFAQQLSTPTVSRLDPTFPAYAYYYFVDQNGDNIYQPSEPNFFLFGDGFDIDFPTTNPNRTDPGLDPEITNELVASVEHAFLPEFVVGANVTYRLTEDVQDERNLIRLPDGSVRVATRDDYVLDGTTTAELPDGRTVTVPFYAINPAVGSFTGGTFLTNGDSEVEYLGASVNFTKRLSNRWMARGYFNYGEPEFQLGSTDRSFADPTNASGTDEDGELFAVQSAGSGNKGDVWLQSSWSANLNGMYQVAPDRPWGFNIAGNLFAREGYPLPYFNNVTGTSDGITRAVQLVDDLDTFRTDDVVTFDLRLEKDMVFTDNLSGILSLDVFNVFNENTVLQRERNLSGDRGNFLDETLSPRIYRLGFRLNWR